MSYNKVDLKKVQERMLEHKHMADQRKNKANFLDLKEGQTKIRILPPWSSEGAWAKSCRYHYGVKEKSTVACIKFHLNQPCPACEVVEELYATKNQGDRDLAYDLRATPRFFANVLDLTKNDGKVYVWAFGSMIEKKIISIMIGSDDPGSVDSFGYGDITDPVTGKNLLVTKVVPTDKRRTSYDVQCSSNPTPVANWNTIKDSLYDLDAYLASDIMTYEEMKAHLENRAPVETVAKTREPLVTPDNGELNASDAFEQPRAANLDEFKPAVAVNIQTAIVPAPTSSNPAPVSQAVANTPSATLANTLSRLRSQKTIQNPVK